MVKLTKSEIVKQAFEAQTRQDLRKLTVQQLRTAVREATKDVNVRSQTRTSEQSEVALNKLKIAGLEVADRSSLEKSKKQMKKSRLSANVNWKSKEELIDQYQALRKYQKADTESEEAMKEYEKGFSDAFEKFQKSSMGKQYSNITQSEFKNIINKLDTYESAISKKEFKYEIFEAVKTYKEQNNTGDVSNAIDKIFDAINGSATSDEAIDNMYRAIGLTR